MTFQIEQFPDGEYNVPLTREEGGSEIGRAVVKFKDGKFTADIMFDDKLAEELDLRLTFFSMSVPFKGEKSGLIVKRMDEEF